MLFLVHERLHLCERPIRCRYRTVHASQDPDLQIILQFISETEKEVLRNSVCQIMPSFSSWTPDRHHGLKSFRERCAFLDHSTTCHGTNASQAGRRRSLLWALLTSRDGSRWNSDNAIRLSGYRIDITEARRRIITSATSVNRKASNRHHAIRPPMRFSEA